MTMAALQQHLSPQQFSCVYYLLQDKSNKEIAKLLELSPRTVEHYLEAARHKLECRSRLELVKKVLILTMNRAE